MVDRYDPAWFTTAGLPLRRGQDAAVKLFAGLLGDVSLHFGEANGRPARIVHCALPGILITTCVDVRAVIRSERGTVPADIILVRPVGGRIRLRQGGREMSLDERCAALVALGHPFELDATRVERFDFLRMAAPVAAHKQALYGWLVAPAPASDNRLVLLTHYAGALLQGMIPLHSERHARLAGNHLRDLAGALFGLDDPAQGALSPAVRLAAIRYQVDRDYARRDLSVESVARLHGVTSRYVQKLFAQEGTTFSRYLLERRLAAAHALLTSEDGPPARVGIVALEAGFGDLSYFVRTFRARYGVPPSQISKHDGPKSPGIPHS